MSGSTIRTNNRLAFAISAEIEELAASLTALEEIGNAYSVLCSFDLDHVFTSLPFICLCPAASAVRIRDPAVMIILADPGFLPGIVEFQLRAGHGGHKKKRPAS